MKKIHNLPGKKTLRQKLRHNATPAEKVLWRSLKKSGVGAKFRRQHGVGSYVLDFYCAEHKLAIEIEGSVHEDVIRRDYDAERQAYLESCGIRVLYFENRALLELIRSAVLEPPPRLARRGDGPIRQVCYCLLRSASFKALRQFRQEWCREA